MESISLMSWVAVPPDTSTITIENTFMSIYCLPPYDDTDVDGVIDVIATIIMTVAIIMVDALTYCMRSSVATLMSRPQEI